MNPFILKSILYIVQISVWGIFLNFWLLDSWLHKTRLLNVMFSLRLYRNKAEI